MLKEIGQVATFLICAGMLLHFRAKESYEKYIRLIISMMVLLLLVQPFWGMMTGGKNNNLMWLIKSYEAKMDTSLLAFQPDERDMEAVLKSLAGQAASQVQTEEQTKEAPTDSAATGIVDVDEVRIEQIGIGEDYGDYK